MHVRGRHPIVVLLGHAACLTNKGAARNAAVLALIGRRSVARCSAVVGTPELAIAQAL